MNECGKLQISGPQVRSVRRGEEKVLVFSSLLLEFFIEYSMA